ncbi:MAG: hypothetical protein Q5535_02290, partial [Haemophilus sp.]|nr:hypothetical protein [Haemophilus sp.]
CSINNVSVLACAVQLKVRSSMMAHASQRVPNFTKKHFQNSPHFTLYILHNPQFPLSYSLSHSLYSRNFIDE